MILQKKWPVHLLVTPMCRSLELRDFTANSKHQTPPRLARQLAKSYPVRKFVVADEEYAAKGTRYFNWGPEKNRIEVWRQVMPSYLKALYESMLARMQAVISQEGGHTKYREPFEHVFVPF